MVTSRAMFSKKVTWPSGVGREKTGNNGGGGGLLSRVAEWLKGVNEGLGATSWPDEGETTIIEEEAATIDFFLLE